MNEPTAAVLDADVVDDAPDGLALLMERFHHGPPVPVADLLDMRPGSAERGRVVFHASADPRFANPMGGLHGGIIATLLDSALGCAAMTVLPPGKLYTTVTLELKYLRPVELDGSELTATGVVVHAGRSQITAEGTLTDTAGKVVATATTTCLVLG